MAWVRGQHLDRVAREAGMEVERLPIGRTAAYGLPRRALLGAALGVAGALLLPTSARAGMSAVDRTFRVLRKGQDIGRHHVAFTHKGEDLAVEVTVELVVKMAFITVYRFRQSGRDLWRGGVLVEAHTATNDDGQQSELVARAEGGSLHVAGASGSQVLPLGSMTDLCFWNDEILRAPQVVDTQTGAATRLQTERGSRAPLLVAGDELMATSYRVDAGDGRAGTIWYDESEAWVRADFTTRGERLVYELL